MATSENTKTKEKLQKGISGTKKKTGKKKKNARVQRDERGHFLPGNNIAEKWTEQKALKMGREIIAWMKEAPKNFFLKDFLLEHDLYTDVISYLSERFPRFSVYIAHAKEIEASRIEKGALGGVLNPGFSQWVLAVHHGMKNVQETKQEVNGTLSALVPQIVLNMPKQSDVLDSEDVNSGTTDAI